MSEDDIYAQARRLRELHYGVLRLLVHRKWEDTNFIASAFNITTSVAYQRLMALRSYGFVKDEQNGVGFPITWHITRRGRVAFDYLAPLGKFESMP